MVGGEGEADLEVDIQGSWEGGTLLLQLQGNSLEHLGVRKMIKLVMNSCFGRKTIHES